MKQKLKKNFCIIALLLVVLAIKSHAFANGGPNNSGPDETSGIFFDENSNIALVEETILFSVIEEKYPAPKAKVSANYNLNNLDDLHKELRIFFIVPSQSSEFSITWNDIDISKSCEYKEIPLPKNWISSSHHLYNPENSEILSSYNHKTDDQYLSRIRGIDIPISISGNEKSRLNVEYTSRGGFYKGHEVKNTVYSFMYYLTPAKFWNGTPQVTLKVKLPPDDRYSFYSNISLIEVEKGYYEGQLTSIPEHEWFFSYNSKAGLIYGTNKPDLHLKINVSVILFLYIVALLLSRHFRKRWINVLGYIFSVLYFFLFTGKISDGYLGDAITYFMLFMILVIIVPFIYFIYLYIYRKKQVRIK